MSDRIVLAATVRSITGKNANRKLRAAGITPAVFYSTNGESFPVQVAEAPLHRLYSTAGRTTVFSLEVEKDGKKSTYPCLIWDVEYYPTKARFQHVDFYGVDLNKELKIRVPLEFVGTAKGTKIGGKLEVYREQIEVLSKPTTLPKKIVVDIANLDINQGLRIADLIMPEGVRASFDDNYAIVTVIIPGAEDKDSDGK